ncbi:MAG TPA: phage portal protein [Micromonospora sp.]|nr:phage portal protein [Micromonospora sp.]
MPLSQDESAAVERLSQKLMDAQSGLQTLDAYYEGEQRLQQLGLAVPPALQRFLTVVNWPRMAADGVEERLDIEGFRLPGVDEADDELWRIWQDNNLDEESGLAHLDALIYSRSYVCVGSNESDPGTPLVTVESPFELIHETDPRTRRVTGALRLYDVVDGRARKGTLYVPGVTVWLEWSDTYAVWRDVDRDEHGMDPPVVPLVNRARASRRGGASEMQDLIPITDAAARTLTNLQLAQETHSVPQRFVVGAAAGDFVDQNGQPLTKWEAYFNSVWALANEEAKVGQLAASDLTNLTSTVEHYARMAAGMAALPPNYFGLAADDAASADAIRSREARLVKRCERKQTAWSGAWEQVMRLVLQVAGNDDPAAKRLQTLWRDPATPTKAQQADATVKLVQAGILPREGAWDDLRYSPPRQERLRAQFARQAAEDPAMAFVQAGTQAIGE